MDAGILVLVDEKRLKRAAWARLHTARKRLEKTTRDLHRHEEIDDPGYKSWLHRTFPLLVTALRELHEELLRKAAKIQSAQSTAWMTGRSIKRVWRETVERERHPEKYPDKPEGEDGDPPDENSAESNDSGNFERTPEPPRTRTAKAIYRRLVMRLHPDSGGAWTAARERLWHEVGQAWDAGDTDWLARLEIEWEAANEILTEASPLGRLYRALEELDAARRDLERKLREYRRSPAWRFSLREKQRAEFLVRTEAQLETEIRALQRQMRPLDAMIHAWEDDWTRADARARGSRWRRRWSDGP